MPVDDSTLLEIWEGLLDQDNEWKSLTKAFVGRVEALLDPSDEFPFAGIYLEDAKNLAHIYHLGFSLDIMTKEALYIFPPPANKHIARRSMQPRFLVGEPVALSRLREAPESSRFQFSFVSLSQTTRNDRLLPGSNTRHISFILADDWQSNLELLQSRLLSFPVWFPNCTNIESSSLPAWIMNTEQGRALLCNVVQQITTTAGSLRIRLPMASSVTLQTDFEGFLTLIPLLRQGLLCNSQNLSEVCFMTQQRGFKNYCLLTSWDVVNELDLQVPADFVFNNNTWNSISAIINLRCIPTFTIYKTAAVSEERAVEIHKDWILALLMHSTNDYSFQLCLTTADRIGSINYFELGKAIAGDGRINATLLTQLIPKIQSTVRFADTPTQASRPHSMACFYFGLMLENPGWAPLLTRNLDTQIETLPSFPRGRAQHGMMVVLNNNNSNSNNNNNRQARGVSADRGVSEETSNNSNRTDYDRQASLHRLRHLQLEMGSNNNNRNNYGARFHRLRHLQLEIPSPEDQLYISALEKVSDRGKKALARKKKVLDWENELECQQQQLEHESDRLGCNNVGPSRKHIWCFVYGWLFLCETILLMEVHHDQTSISTLACLPIIFVWGRYKGPFGTTCGPSIQIDPWGFEMLASLAWLVIHIYAMSLAAFWTSNLSPTFQVLKVLVLLTALTGLHRIDGRVVPSFLTFLDWAIFPLMIEVARVIMFVFLWHKIQVLLNYWTQV